jgi:Ribonuclease G/E
VRAGERWRFSVRLRRPHGQANPVGLDYEAWLLERNIRATGYVYEKGGNLNLAEETISPAYLVQHLREIVREARQFSAREFRILASQQVIDLFLDEESQALAQLSDFIAKPVSLQVESLYSQEQYDVILM